MAAATHTRVAVLLCCCFALFSASARAREKCGEKELRDNLVGYIALPGDAAYARAVDIDNGRIQNRPDIVVMPLADSDVLLAMAVAKKCGYPFAVKSGGHSAAGYCLPNKGLALDMSTMNATSFDTDDHDNPVMHAQVGAIWGEIYDRINASKSGFIPVGGACPTVGISGFTMGGGYSFLSRSYGLAIDNVLAYTVALANGSIVTVRSPAQQRQGAQDSDDDLFWALSGGGGGNFGVLLNLTVKMHQPSPKVLWGMMCWGLANTTQLLHFYNHYANIVPDQLAMYGWFGHLHGEKQFCLTPVYNGDYDEGMQLLQPLLDYSPSSWQPLYTSFLELESLEAGFTSVKHRKAFIKSGVIPPMGITDQLISVLQQAIATAPSVNTSMLWVHVGGAIARVASNATAFPWRSAGFIFEVKAIWEHDDEEHENIRWVQKLGADIAPFIVGGYVNYIDPSLPDWQRMYYGDNYDRLVKVKQSVDPHDFFKFKQSIGSRAQKK